MRLLAMLAIGLTGCATGGPDPQGPRVPVPMSAETEAPDLGALRTYGVPRGRCGMILYTLAGATPVPIFRSTDDGTAIMEIERQVTPLALVGRGGTTRMAIPSMQYFQGHLASGEAITVAAQTEWGQPFQGGSYVRSGTMTVTAANGWSRVVPVAGIAGCKA
jgi:hypothetical protein